MLFTGSSTSVCVPIFTILVSRVFTKGLELLFVKITDGISTLMICCFVLIKNCMIDVHGSLWKDGHYIQQNKKINLAVK